MRTNTAIDMTDNQCNVFDFNTFINNSEENRNAIIAHLGKSDVNQQNKDTIMSDLAIMYLEGNYKCQTEKEFWQWLDRKWKGIKKLNNKNEPDSRIVLVDFNTEKNSDCIDDNQIILNVINAKNAAETDKNTEVNKLIANEEKTDKKTAETILENTEVEETNKPDTETKQGNSMVADNVIDLQKIIDGANAIIRIKNLLTKVDFKMVEWQSVKKWKTKELDVDNEETKKSAITLSKMKTDWQRIAWIIIDYYIDQIEKSKSSWDAKADYLFAVTGIRISRQSLSALIARATKNTDINTTSVKLPKPRKTKTQSETTPKTTPITKVAEATPTAEAAPIIKSTPIIESAPIIKSTPIIESAPTNVILIIDFIKQYKQLDFSQKSKIGVTNNKVVNGCSSGGKKNAFSASPNAPKAITKTIYAEIIKNNINKKLANVNNKKTSNQSKILQFNAFTKKSIKSKAIGGNNNTFCQAISLPLPLPKPNQAQQQYYQPFNRQFDGQFRKIIKRTKWRTNMLARDGP